MSIRPIDFNGMMQNTQEISHSKLHDDNAPLVQQSNVARELEEASELSTSQVHEQEDAAAEGQLDADREGDGRGYRVRVKKSKKKNKVKEKVSDGSVKVKNAHGSFDMKI